jgi:hypothetical protein
MAEIGWTIRNTLTDALPRGESLRGKTQEGHQYHLEHSSVIINNLPYGMMEQDMMWPLISFAGIIPDALHCIADIAVYSVKPHYPMIKDEQTFAGLMFIGFTSPELAELCISMWNGRNPYGWLNMQYGLSIKIAHKASDRRGKNDGRLGDIRGGLNLYDWTPKYHSEIIPPAHARGSRWTKDNSWYER